MIPEAAVEAAAKGLSITTYDNWGDAPDHVQRRYLSDARAALEAAAPHMLSHEREETRLAHVDALVNARTVDKLNTAIEAVLFMLCEPGANAVPWNKPDMVPPFYSDRIRGVITEALSK